MAEDGILQPPKETKDIIDKVAAFVAKSPDGEARLLKEQGNNEALSFLHPTSPFFAYYKQKVREERTLLESSVQKSDEKQGTVEEKSKEVVEEPPKFEWILPTDPATIPALDFDIICLTARFVARNGRSCQMGLWNRENRNPQFGFLQSHHPLHSLYQALVDAYTRIIVPPSDIIENLSKQKNPKQQIIDKIVKRKNWKKSQAKTEEEQKAEQEAERSAIAAIDWNDAIIVETIVFNPEEDDRLPAPIEQSKLLSVYLATKALEEQEATRRAQEQKEQSNMPITAAPVPTGLPPVDNKPQEPRTAVDLRRGIRKPMTTCPICRQAIPIDEMEMHMKIEMSRQGTMQMEEATRASLHPEKTAVVAAGEDVHAQLTKMARKRTDLFGDEEDEEAAAAARREERAKREREAQAAAAAASRGYVAPEQPERVPNQPMPTYPSTNYPAIPQKAGIVPPSLPAESGKRPAPSDEPEDTPASKKAKVAEFIDLVPEKEWVEKHPEDLTVIVILGESELESGAQTLEITVPPLTSVKDLKTKISSLLPEPIPVNKQIIKTEQLGFLKDKLTMAHYNLTTGSKLLLSTKERGGRKK